MKKIILCFLLLLEQVTVFGQIISGKVTDENQKPLPYVNIGIIGLDRGTISSTNGEFQIDISNLDNEQLLSFSIVGFESYEFKIGALNALTPKFLNVVLREMTYLLQQVVIKPDNEKPIYIGSQKAGRMAWVGSEAKNGAEIGTLFRNNRQIQLKKFDFHVRNNHCDSIYYRIKIYDGENEIPRELINTEEIRFLSKVKKGWDSVDLSGLNIKVDRDFIITLETLEAWTNKENCASHLSIGKASKGTLSFSRASSMAPWIEFGDSMAFRVEAFEY